MTRTIVEVASKRASDRGYEVDRHQPRTELYCVHDDQKDSSRNIATTNENGDGKEMREALKMLLVFISTVAPWRPFLLSKIKQAVSVSFLVRAQAVLRTADQARGAVPSSFKRFIIIRDLICTLANQLLARWGQIAPMSTTGSTDERRTRTCGTLRSIYTSVYHAGKDVGLRRHVGYGLLFGRCQGSSRPTKISGKCPSPPPAICTCATTHSWLVGRNQSSGDGLLPSLSLLWGIRDTLLFIHAVR